MPMTVMAFLLPALVIGVVVFLFLQRRKLLREVLVIVARRECGKVVSGPLGFYPLAKIPLNEGELLLSGIHGGQSGRVTSTFAWIGCEAYGDRALDIRRKPQRAGMLARVGHEELQTGHSRFDAAFWLADGEPDAASDLLDDEIRELLMGFDSKLRVRLRIGTLVAFPDGWRTGETEPSLEIALHKLPASVADVEQLIKLARVVHGRLCRGNQARTRRLVHAR